MPEPDVEGLRFDPGGVAVRLVPVVGLFIDSELVPVERPAALQGWPLAPMRPGVVVPLLDRVPGVLVVGRVGEVVIVPMLLPVVPEPVGPEPAPALPPPPPPLPPWANAMVLPPSRAAVASMASACLVCRINVSPVVARQEINARRENAVPWGCAIRIQLLCRSGATSVRRFFCGQAPIRQGAHRAEIFSAASVDGYTRLTARASKKFSRCKTLRPSLGFERSRNPTETPMPRTDGSVAILAGMIIAALYVILLLGASRESYMRRDADIRAEAVRPPAAAPDVPKDVPKNVCRVDPACVTLP
jgi:hypothetical protein